MYKEVIEFIKDLYPGQAFIPLHAPIFIGNEKKYTNECIDTTFVSSVGKFVDEFEVKVANYTGAKMAVACVNGTSALHLALKIIGVDVNDEVIMQPLTFIATANAISYCGASPIFIDVNKETMGLCPDKLEEWLIENAYLSDKGYCCNKNTGKTIRACVPMHTFGHPVKMKELEIVCKKWNIVIIEDAAESIGSYYYGNHTGTSGKIGVLSFNGNKLITTGGGGMLLFNDLELGKYAKHLTTQAKVPHRWEFDHDNVGYNYRMPNINAAIGCAQMECIDLFLEKKRKLAKAYRVFFSDAGIEFFNEPDNCQSNYWLNVILLKDRVSRDEFLTLSNDSGVMTRPVWKLINKLKMFESCQKGDLTNSEWFENRIVNVPSSVKI